MGILLFSTIKRCLCKAKKCKLKRMKSPKEDYNIRKSVALDSGLDPKKTFRSFYTIVINNVFQFQHFGCFGPVVKHQNQHLKASKATSNQI